MRRYIGSKLINAKPMTRKEYNDLRNWEVPVDEDGNDEGYLVEYIDGGKSNHPGFDGYISWSPKEVFDNAYRPTDGMPFGMAIESMKLGFKVSRAGWNGKGLGLRLQVPDENSKMTLPYIYMEYPSKPASDTAPANHINARVPWLASQTDMLSDDWMVVDA